MVEIGRREFIGTIGGLVASIFASRASQISLTRGIDATLESRLRDSNLSKLILEDIEKYKAAFNAYSESREENKQLGYEPHPGKTYYAINCGETQYGQLTVLIPAKIAEPPVGTQRRRLTDSGKPIGPSENGPIYVRFQTRDSVEYLSDEGDIDGLPNSHYKGFRRLQDRVSIENLPQTQISSLPENFQEAIFYRFELGLTRAVNVLSSAATGYFVGGVNR